MATAGATGMCILCNVEVTEEDYRREIDCPSKTCPGRIYHEDCIAAYLKRTKYSKDRCTGFPCPAILSTGKPCPGYVCKMHNYFPANQKKKQARVQAALLAQAAPKPKMVPAPAKSKASGAQVAIAAIRRSAPEDAPASVTQKVVKAAQGHGVLLQASNGGAQPRVIPGLDDALHGMSREVLRARIASARAEAKAGQTSNAKGGGMSGIVGSALQPKMGSNMVKVARPELEVDDDEERLPRPATLWEAFVKTPGMDGDLNYYDLERHNGGGQFTARLRKRLEGGNTTNNTVCDSSFYDGTSSECDSVMTMSSTSSTPNRDGENTSAQPSLNTEHSQHSGVSMSLNNDDFPALPIAACLSPSPSATLNRTKQQRHSKVAAELQAESKPAQLEASLAAGLGFDAAVGGDGTVHVEAYIANMGDRVIEYDMVYAAEDGSYLVFDSVSNSYVTVEAIYGPAPELVECLAEDGNMYMCVAVHAAQQEHRMQWQEEWVQSQFNNHQDPSLAKQQVAPTPQETAAALMALPSTTGGSVRLTAADIIAATTDVMTASTRQDLSTAMKGLGVGVGLVPEVATWAAIAPQHGVEQCVMVGSSMPMAGGVEVAQEEPDDTDVSSLMALLCV